MNQFITILLIFCLPLVVLADHITLNDGTKYEGSIVNATQTHVIMQINDSTVIQIPQARIDNLFFSKADHIILLNNQTIKCKILEEVFPNLLFVTEEGIQKEPIINIKRYFYNEVDSLELSALPPTGNLFDNKVSFREKPKNIRQNFFVNINGGIASPPSNNWKKDFLTAADIFGIQIGGSAGYFVSNNLSVGLGADFITYDNKSEGNLASSLKTSFIYVTASYFANFEFLYFIDFFAGVDFGIFNTTGNIYTYSFREIKIDDSGAIAFRPKIGASYRVTSNLIVNAEGNFIVAKSGNIPYPVLGFEDISIEFNGPLFKAGVTYLFSL